MKKIKLNLKDVADFSEMLILMGWDYKDIVITLQRVLRDGYLCSNFEFRKNILSSKDL